MERIEATGDGQNDVKLGDKEVLPIAQHAPKAPEIPALDQPIPAGKNSEIASDPKQKHGYCHGDTSKNPFYVYVERDKKLSTFEKRTVVLGYVGVGVAALSLLAACIAGFFVYHQWREMNSQTGFMNMAAEQARTEAKNSAVATANQLAAIQAQVTSAQAGARALQGQLNQYRRMADVASEQLQITDRPWVGIRGRPSIIGGSIHDNAAAVNFVYDLVNEGKSVALGVSDGVWVAGGAANGLKLMGSDHCEQMARSQRQVIALWRQWKKSGGAEPGGVTPKTGSLILPGTGSSIQTAPQEGAPNVREEDIYVLVCTTYFDQLGNVHLTQNMYCLTSEFPKLSEVPLYCGKGNYAY